jgi:hypothetical protein
VVTGATDYGNPHEDLHRADPGISGGLYDRLVAFYEHFRSPAPRGIAMAKISKVLHLKRPAAIPILDRKIASTYLGAAVGRRFSTLSAAKSACSGRRSGATSSSTPSLGPCPPCARRSSEWAMSVTSPGSRTFACWTC